MILVGADNIRLLCVNCGAVYEDVWGSRQTEPQPVCPYCLKSFYRDTDEVEEPYYHGPVKASYPVGQKAIDNIEKFDFWARYKNLREELDKEGIDEAIAHSMALRNAKVVSSINRYVLGNAARIDSYRKYWREVAWPQILAEGLPVTQFPSGNDTQLTMYIRKAVADLTTSWNSGTMHSMTLQEAINLRFPGYESSIEQRREYYAVKTRLNRLRKQAIERREKCQ